MEFTGLWDVKDVIAKRQMAYDEFGADIVGKNIFNEKTYFDSGFRMTHANRRYT